MAVTESIPLQSYTASGASAVFGFSFQVLSESDMSVTVDGVAPLSFTVSGVGNPAGGTVTISPTPAAGARVVLFRDSAIERLIDYQTNGDLLAPVVNRDFDRLWLVLQEIVSAGKGSVGTLRVPGGETLSTLPEASQRADKFAVFGPSGDSGVSAFTVGQVAALLAASSVSGISAGHVAGVESQTLLAGETVVTLQSNTYTPGTSSIVVFADGQLLTPGVDFTETGPAQITLASAFGDDAELVIIVGRLVTSGVDAAAVSFQAPGGIGRSLYAKAMERLSVVDFGADPTGQLDSTAAIQLAIDTTYALGGGEVWLPAGTYKTSATIKLKRHTSLIGPVHRLPTASSYGGNIEATIIGMAQIKPTAALTGCAIMWDYQLADKLARPYGARLENILLDLDACTGNVDGIYARHPPAGEGVFGNGWAGGSTWAYACAILRCPRYGIFVESSDTEKVNIGIERCRVAFCGSHGINAFKCFDVSISYSFSYANAENGINMYGCATERVHHNDVFNNLGHGIVMDGFDAAYSYNAVENNHKHGIYIRADGTTQTDKRYKIIGGRVGTNSYGTDDTYDNIHIEDRAGVACTQILIDAVTFGPQAHVGTANRVRHQIHSTALPAQSACTLSNCFVVGLDRKSGNDIFNANVWESFIFDNSYDPAGQLLGQQMRTLTPWTGSSTSVNVLRGVNRFRTANVASATLAGFNAGSSRLEGREVWVLIDDANTAVDFSGSTLKGNGGVDLAAGASQGKLLHFVNYDGTNWAATIYG